MVWVLSDSRLTAGPALYVQPGAPIAPLQPSTAAVAFLPTRACARATVPNATPVVHRPLGGAGSDAPPPPPPPPQATSSTIDPSTTFTRTMDTLPRNRLVEGQARLRAAISASATSAKPAPRSARVM